MYPDLAKNAALPFALVTIPFLLVMERMCHRLGSGRSIELTRCPLLRAAICKKAVDITYDNFKDRWSAGEDKGST